MAKRQSILFRTILSDICFKLKQIFSVSLINLYLGLRYILLVSENLAQYGPIINRLKLSDKFCLIKPDRRLNCGKLIFVECAVGEAEFICIA